MKRWIFIFFVLGVFFFTILAILTSQVRFPIILPTGKVLASKFYDYAGITHVHSASSTGSGSINDLIKAASITGCSFLIVTDLNPSYDPEKIEGYRNEVLIAGAGEYSYLTGHLLAYDLKESKSFKGPGQSQIFFNDLLEKKARPIKNGFVVAAHPFLPQHSWDNLYAPGLTGMEVLNLDSLWHGEILQNKFSLLWSFLILPFNADLSYLRLYSEPNKELTAWDAILNKKQFIGYGGNDSTANAIPFPEHSFSFPSYSRSFRLLKDHVLLRSELTGSYKEDRKKIMEALGQGQFYFSIDLLGDPSGFYFIAQQRRKEFLLGSTLKSRNGPVTFNIELGHDIGVSHEIILLRNGLGVLASQTASLIYTTKEPGAYRAIVRVTPTLSFPDGKKTITWIFSNPVRVE
jgi:hypothetical protein